MELHNHLGLHSHLDPKHKCHYPTFPSLPWVRMELLNTSGQTHLLNLHPVKVVTLGEVVHFRMEAAWEVVRTASRTISEALLLSAPGVVLTEIKEGLVDIEVVVVGITNITRRAKCRVGLDSVLEGRKGRTREMTRGEMKSLSRTYLFLLRWVLLL